MGGGVRRRNGPRPGPPSYAPQCVAVTQFPRGDGGRLHPGHGEGIAWSEPHLIPRPAARPDYCQVRTRGGLRRYQGSSCHLCPGNLFRVMRKLGLSPQAEKKPAYNPKPYQQMTLPRPECLDGCEGGTPPLHRRPGAAFPYGTISPSNSPCTTAAPTASL